MKSIGLRLGWVSSPWLVQEFMDNAVGIIKDEISWSVFLEKDNL